MMAEEGTESREGVADGLRGRSSGVTIGRKPAARLDESFGLIHVERQRFMSDQKSRPFLAAALAH